jgi:hypothetical protein
VNGQNQSQEKQVDNSGIKAAFRVHVSGRSVTNENLQANLEAALLAFALERALDVFVELTVFRKDQDVMDDAQQPFHTQKLTPEQAGLFFAIQRKLEPESDGSWLPKLLDALGLELAP